MTISMNIIGTGKVAKTIAHLFVKQQLVKIAGVYNRTEQHAVDAIGFIGEGQYYQHIADLPHAEMTMITTSDDVISSICHSLFNNQSLQQNDIIFHCSGSLSSDCLLALKEKGCLIASVHPMRSFQQSSRSVEEYPGTFCALEGDEGALRVLWQIFAEIGSIMHVIQKDKKAMYHAAAVFASNYLVTLAQHAFLCLNEAGVQGETARSLIHSLMHGTISNIEKVSQPRDALTGPVQRGDTAVINLHLAAFNNPQQQALYAFLVEATRSLYSG